MIKVKVDGAQVRYVQKRLGNMRDKAPTVIMRAVNKTATSARQKLATQNKKVYTYHKSVRSQMEIRKASSGNLSAEIVSSGKPHNLTSFSHSSSKNGVQVKPLRAGSKKQLIGNRQIKAWKTKKIGGARGAILQRKGKEKYPVKFHSGTSTPKMLESEKVYGQVKGEISEMLKKNIENQIRLLTR